MTTLEEIEARLIQSRGELAAAQHKLSDTDDRANQLDARRAPLVRDAKVRGDKKVAGDLAKLTRERDDARQDVADFRSAIDQIQSEILSLERQHEQGIRDETIENVRRVMKERGTAAENIEKCVGDLVSLIARYVENADKAVALIYELELPNATTHHMRGIPLLKVFIQQRLKSIFPELPWVDTEQRQALVEMERQARETLERSIQGARNAA